MKIQDTGIRAENSSFFVTIQDELSILIQIHSLASTFPGGSGIPAPSFAVPKASQHH
jgi:hypothetical protein